MVERLFDRPAVVDDSADGLDDGERVVVAGVEYVAPDERAAHVRPGLEPREQFTKERRRVADGLAAEEQDGERRRVRDQLVVLAVGQLQPEVSCAVAERRSRARRA